MEKEQIHPAYKKENLEITSEKELSEAKEAAGVTTHAEVVKRFDQEEEKSKEKEFYKKVTIDGVLIECSNKFLKVGKDAFIPGNDYDTPGKSHMKFDYWIEFPQRAQEIFEVARHYVTENAERYQDGIVFGDSLEQREDFFRLLKEALRDVDLSDEDWEFQQAKNEELFKKSAKFFAERESEKQKQEEKKKKEENIAKKAGYDSYYDYARAMQIKRGEYADEIYYRQKNYDKKRQANPLRRLFTKSKSEQDIIIEDAKKEQNERE